MRLLILSVSVLLLTCHQAVGQKSANQAKIKAGRVSSANVIEGRCAVIVRPDAKKIAQMKRESSPEDYDVSVNDYEYYVGTSVEFLNSAKVRQIRKPAHGVLIFKSLSGQYFKISLADVYWGIFLFNGRSKPVEADMTNIGASYRAYMKSKRR